MERLGAESARERIRWVSVIWYVPWMSVFLLILTAFSGRSSIAQSQYPIGRKHSHLQALCVQSAQWRARALTWDPGYLAHVLRHSYRPWTPFLIFLTFSLFRDLAQGLCLTSHHCTHTLLMMMLSSTKLLSILEIHR
jgi:hypothetical protein